MQEPPNLESKRLGQVQEATEQYLSMILKIYPKRKNIADIICIGAQKAGTSWLHSMFSAHPRTHTFMTHKGFTCSNKEAHFWDWNINKGINWYKKLMRPPKSNLLTLDFTPEYSFLPITLIEECKKHNPDAFVFYVLREPVDRAISALRMYYLWIFGKDAATTKRISFDDEFLKIMQKSRLLDQSSYVACAERWLKYYPNLQIINYDALKDTPKDTVLSLFNNANLNYEELNDQQKYSFEKKLTQRVWESTSFGIDDQVVNYLKSIFEPHRNLAEKFFGIHFKKNE